MRSLKTMQVHLTLGWEEPRPLPAENTYVKYVQARMWVRVDSGIVKA